MSTITRRTTQGERLARSRMFSGISQTEMAKILGKSKGTISNWENDHVDPPLSAMAHWAVLTHRSIDWIAFGDGNENSPAEIDGGDEVRPKGFEPLAFCSVVTEVPETAAEMIALFETHPPTYAHEVTHQ